MWNSTRGSAFLWVFFIVMLQNALHFIFPDEMFPLLLVAVVFYSLSEGPYFGFGIGCYAGIFMDLLGPGRMGVETALWGLIGMLSGWAASTLFRDSWPTQILFPTAANLALVIMNHLIYRASFAEGGGAPFSNGSEWRSILFTLLLSPTLFKLLRAVSFAKKERSLRWR